MTYEETYKELVELSHSYDSNIKEKADVWLISIGLQGAVEMKVSDFLLDLVVRNVKGEITRDDRDISTLKVYYEILEYYKRVFLVQLVIWPQQ